MPDLDAARGPTASQINQLKNMSPAQQKALAAQYGIQIPAGPSGRSENNQVAAPEAPLDQDRFKELENLIVAEEANQEPSF
ncbi:MAG: hypothetical protein ACJ0RQ_05410 [Candidatus Azotimanducaceae bacterium]